jgi:hypothetical protein
MQIVPEFLDFLVFVITSILFYMKKLLVSITLLCMTMCSAAYGQIETLFGPIY